MIQRQKSRIRLESLHLRAFVGSVQPWMSTDYTQGARTQGMASGLSRERTFAVRVMHEAALLCARAPRNARLKADATPVTVADLAIQAMVIKALHDSFPNDVLVAEEDASMRHDECLWKAFDGLLGFESYNFIVGADIPNSTQYDVGPPRYWTLDPIDGTKGFICGLSYSIGLALLRKVDCAEESQKPPSFGAIALPSEGVLLVADVEGGYLKELPLLGTRQRKNMEKRARSQTRNVAECDIVWMMSGVQDLQLEGWPAWTPFCCGSLVKYAAVARGNATAFVQVVIDKSPAVWDHAAGVAAVFASGGFVSDDRGQPITFGSSLNRREVGLSQDAVAIVASRRDADHYGICDLVRKTLNRDVTK